MVRQCVPCRMIMRKKHRGIVLGAALLVSVLFMGTEHEVYASSPINDRGEGQVEIDGEGEISLDINLQKSGGTDHTSASISSSTSSIHSSASNGTTTKPSTNQVGTGLNDGIAKNAKTGDVFNGKNMIILFGAAGAVILLLGLKKRNIAERD